MSLPKIPIDRTPAQMREDAQKYVDYPGKLKVTPGLFFAAIGLVDQIIGTDNRKKILMYFYGVDSAKNMKEGQQFGWTSFVQPHLAEVANIEGEKKSPRWKARSNLETDLLYILGWLRSEETK